MPYNQVIQWYQTYLGRSPTQQELNAWANHLNRGQPVTDIQSYLLSSSEFYDRHQNNPDLYLRGLLDSMRCMAATQRLNSCKRGAINTTR